MRRVAVTSGALGALGAVVALLWFRRHYKRQPRDSTATEVKVIPEEKATTTTTATPATPATTAVPTATTSAPQNLSVSWAAQAVQAAKDAMATRDEKPSEETIDTVAPSLASNTVDTTTGENILQGLPDVEQAVSNPSTPEAAMREYIVDNTLLQAHTPGLCYRRTKSSAARVEKAWEPWGKVVKGVDEGDWLRVGQLFLPKTLGGITVLYSKHSKKRMPRSAKNGTAKGPQYVDSLVSWPTGSDSATMDTESSQHSASSSVRSMGEASAYETPRKVPVSQVFSSLAAPMHGWQYLDETGSVRGPFSLDEMKHWNSKGYFRADLLMRCHPEDSFAAFAALFPAPLVPFQSHPQRPRRSGLRSNESPR